MKVGKVLFGLLQAVALAAALGLTAAGSAWITVQLAFRGRETRVPDLTGLAEAEGRKVLEAEGLRIKVSGRRYSPAVEAGRIFEQQPPAGSKLKRNRTVRVTLSLGLRTFQVPACGGLALPRALDRIRAAGMREGQVVYVHSLVAPDGSVLAQEPEPGARSARSDRVDLVVSRGPRRYFFVMPNLAGRTVEDARAGLENFGFVLGSIERRYLPSTPGGRILAQYPVAGSRVGPGQNVSLVVSEGLENPDGGWGRP